MNYYQESYGYGVIDDRPMLGPIQNDVQEQNSDGNRDRDLDYDVDEDKKFNQLLDEMNEELSPKHSKVSPEKDDLSNNNNRIDAPVPSWYKQKIQSKIKDTQSRLEEMSKKICYMCRETYDHIQRIERDHGAVFCKMDYPKNPSLDKPWTNSWKFNCTLHCKDAGKPYHDHTADCESVVLEHIDTGVSLRSSNICHNEYPKFVMDAVELFQDFANETIGTVPIFDVKGATDKKYDKSMWTGIKLVVRSNYEEHMMLVVRGKGISSLIPKLRRYFNSGPGKHSNVISVFCLDQKWSKQKGKIEATNVTGLYKLRDRIGPITIEYKPKISVEFNSVEAIELARIIQNYAGLTVETTLLDIGCNFGVLSLLMSDKCEMVIGVNTMHSLNWDMVQAEELKKLNGRENVTFLGCDPEELLTKCSPFIQRCISVAVLNLSSAYGKNKKVMQALRNMPSIWRVIVYGSFTKEFHNNITTLIAVDDAMGERFLPMQGCILDKSPSIDKAFDIVILFERTSLIEPKIELLAAGPTVNVKHDPFSWDAKAEKAQLQLDRVKKSEGSREKCKRSPPPTTAKDIFDIPARRQEPSRVPDTHREDRREKSNRPTPSTSSHKQKSSQMPSARRDDRRERSNRRSPSITHDRQEERVERSKKSPPPKAADKKMDFSILRQKSSQRSPTPKEKESSASKPKERHVKGERRPPAKEHRSPAPTIEEESSESSAPREDAEFEFEFEFETEKLPRQSTDERRLPSYPPLSVRKDFQFTFTPRSPSPPPPKATDKKIDFSILRQKSSQVPPTPKEKESSASKPKEVHAKEEKRSPAKKHRSPAPTIEEESRKSSAPREDAKIEVEKLPRHSTDERPLPSYPQLSVRKEFHFAFTPRSPSPPPPVPAPPTDDASLAALSSYPLLSVRKEFQGAFTPRSPSPPPPVPAPPTDNGWLDASQIKTEKDADHLSWTVVKSPTPPPIETDCPPPIFIKSEPVPENEEEEEEEGVLGLQNDGILAVPVKSETVAPICSANSSEINCEDIPLPATVKSEPVDSHKDSSQRVSVKNEPADMDISPSIENVQTPIHEPGAPSDIENMNTPIGNSRASSDVSSPLPPAVSTNFTTVAVDGFEFSVQANKSYLSMTSEPANVAIKTEANSSEPSVAVNVKTESDDEIKIIDEKKTDKPKPTIRVKTVEEIIKVKTELKEKEEDELRELYELKQKLLEKLKDEKEPRERPPRSYKRHSSPSRSSRKHNRSPSPRRRNRSPSSKRRRRSSPNERHRRRSPTRIKREPRSSPDRVKREPISPDSRRRRDRGRRSPSFSRREIHGRKRTSRSRSPAKSFKK